jgi:hypothetical protein
MARKIIPDQGRPGTAAEELPGLAEQRPEQWGDLGVVRRGAGQDDRLSGLRLGRNCPGGWCELCPVTIQIECEEEGEMIKATKKLAEITDFVLFDWLFDRDRATDRPAHPWLLAGLAALLFAGCFSLGLAAGFLCIRVAE